MSATSVVLRLSRRAMLAFPIRLLHEVATMAVNGVNALGLVSLNRSCAMVLGLGFVVVGSSSRHR